MSIFREKVVWISGAGTGIGRATAHMFAHEGASVVLFGRRPGPLEGVCQEVCKLGGHGWFASLDVADRAAVEKAGAGALAWLGRVDFLVNNAGLNVRERTLKTLDPEGWDSVIAVNLTGAYNLARAALPAMREQGGGLIVNVSSIAGLRPSALAGAAYTASKHGMVGLSGVINEEEWPHGIRATAICPGEVNTPILAARPVPVPEEEHARMIQPEDVAAAIRFLACLDPRTCVPEMTIMPTHRRSLAAEGGAAGV